MKNILVTGGAGFIGSHTVVELANAGYRPVIVDNFSNSEKSVIGRLESIIGSKISTYEGDFQDEKLLAKVFSVEKPDGIIHFAAYKVAPESVEQPLKYYDNNVSGFVRLLKTVVPNEIPYFVFSSSAAVYGMPSVKVVTEKTVCSPISPYGWSKYMDELILRDTCLAVPSLQGIALRYFNVVGAHESGLLSEPLGDKPQNLLPVIIRACVTHRPLIVFGTDYPTSDGTCLRDYIHVVDLARAHVAALNSTAPKKDNYRVYNIGTGHPTSVLQLIKTFEKVNKVKVPYTLGAKRPGDPSAFHASAKKADAELGWKSEKTIENAVADAWQWYQKSRQALL